MSESDDLALRAKRGRVCARDSESFWERCLEVDGRIGRGRTCREGRRENDAREKREQLAHVNHHRTSLPFRWSRAFGRARRHEANARGKRLSRPLHTTTMQRGTEDELDALLPSIG